MDVAEPGPFNLEMRWLEEISWYYRDLIDVVGAAMNVDRPTFTQVRSIRANTIKVVLSLVATGRYKEKDLDKIKNNVMDAKYETAEGMKTVIDSGFALGRMIASKNLFKKKYGDGKSRWDKI